MKLKCSLAYSNMIRLTIVLSIFLSTCVPVHTQNHNGKIEFKIDYELVQELESQRPSLATKMIVYTKNNFSRKEEVTRIGSQVLINDIKSRSSYLLMQIADEKLAIKVQDSTINNNLKEKITYLNETKNIAGYECKKAIINTYDSTKEEANTIVLFYTDEIIGVYDLKFLNLIGTPLEYKVESKGMTITYTATSVSIAEQNRFLFEIPKDFNILSMSEFKRLMSN